MKCDELKRKYSDITGPYYGYNEVNEAIEELNQKIAEKDAEIARLESDKKTLKLWYVNAKNAMHETEEACAAKDKDIAYWRKEYDEETKLTDALKAEIESLKASHYAESVDAGMRERRLRRAFYKACANWAHIAVAFFSSYVTKDRWRRMERKCRAKAEEYK